MTIHSEYPLTLYTVSPQSWQQEYRLYTEDQQLYFFAFIVAVAAKIKYIDIEFESQAVALPLFADKTIIHDIIGQLLGTDDVSNEKGVAELYKGALIPPPNTSDVSVKKESKTKALQMAHCPPDQGGNPVVVYVQDLKFCTLSLSMCFVDVADLCIH